MTTVARTLATTPASAAPLAGARVVLIGTPETVRAARDLLATVPGGPEPLGCILTDPAQRRAGGGLPVFGGIEDLSRAARRQHLTHAVVSLPTAMAETIVAVRRAVLEAGLQERFLPPVAEMLTQPPPFMVGLATPAGVTPTARFDLATLIGRAPAAADREALARLLAGKRVMITGAGGSIGSELARIAAEFGPSELHLVERAENPLFEIDRQIGRRFTGVRRRAVLHDVVDAEQTLRIMVDLSPHVVFHAAAHKHVPLMEDHPSHAVTNNLFGTKSIADASVAVGVERFVMVSTDKAVNPSSVMGATKRLAELYVQWLDGATRRMSGAGGGTRFGMVRFGNVLGSSASVLTIWSAQLAEGGPLTVTHPEMTRYFMTIHEAATLVLLSAAIEAEGPAAVHVLDMGEPVGILGLARRFARAHGFAACVAGESPDPGDAGLPTVEVAITGVRPGEKLHEELSHAHEQLAPTPYERIRRWTAEVPGPAVGAAMIADLSAVRSSTDRSAVLAAIRKYVPTLPPA
ncbi:MAG: polysaccharide biosynthesis protein [Phycisphaerae bacterium]|nr:polysaccharide biosynthesis protein [Phycisphaerae bacterium]